MTANPIVQAANRPPGGRWTSDAEGAWLLEGDCVEILAGWPPGCVDAVVTDPPWNLGKDYRGHNDSMPEADYVYAALARRRLGT